MKAEDAAEAMDQEHADQNFKRRAGVLIAFFAMLLAITGLGSSNALKEALNQNIQASNTFAFFQAKNMRQTSYALAADQIDLAFANDSALPAEARAKLREKSAAYRKTAARYESEPSTGEGKKELLVKARQHETARDHALRQDPYFDYAEVLLQITIVLISVSIVADQRWLVGVGCIFGALGALLMLNGFFLFVTVPGLG